MLTKILAYDLKELIGRDKILFNDLNRYDPEPSVFESIRANGRRNYIVIKCNCDYLQLTNVFEWLRIKNVDYDSIAPVSYTGPRSSIAIPKEQEKDVVAIDMDGTITDGVCWEVSECEKAKLTLFSEEVKDFFEKSFVVIWTARKNILIPATLKNLDKHGIPFHAVSTEKMSADLYIDDKTINPVIFKAEKIASNILSR